MELNVEWNEEQQNAKPSTKANARGLLGPAHQALSWHLLWQIRHAHLQLQVGRRDRAVQAQAMSAQRQMKEHERTESAEAVEAARSVAMDEWAARAQAAVERERYREAQGVRHQWQVAGLKSATGRRIALGGLATATASHHVG